MKVLVLLLSTSLVALAACSDDDDSADDTGTETSTDPGHGTSSTAPAPDGDPIRLGIISNSSWIGYLPTGAEAAIARINGAGGIDGRPLELVVCDNELNPNSAATCARDFAADESIVATVGDVSGFGGDTNAVLEEAMIAGVGTVPLGVGDFGSPRIFATNSGGLQFLGNATYLHDELGAREMGIAVIDDPTAQALPTLMNGELASRGVELAATAVVPVASADVTAQAAALAGTDGQMLALTEDLALRFIRSSRQQGFAGPIMLSESVVPASSLEESLSPEELDDVYAISWFDKTSEGYADYVEDMTAADPDFEPDDLSANSWLSVNLFAEVASGLDEISRESIWDAMSSVSGFDTRGMTPTLDYTAEATALGGAAPRLVPSVLTVFADRYENGEWVPVSDEQEPIVLFA